MEKKIDEVRAWHTRDRGWRDIGYHFLIDRNGKVGTGRPLEQIGAHVRGRNSGSIGIALFGGHGSAKTDKFEDNFTPEQDAALRQLLAELKNRFSISKVSGHNEYAAKACPGFKVSAWLKNIPAPIIVGYSHEPKISKKQNTHPPAPASGGWVAIINAIFKALGVKKGGKT